ncbi:MAG: aconitate hydratase [Tissierellia bacterium]|nr:aconitate hydratase [Tissierellia bacterium]
MQLPLFYKIIKSHLINGDLEPGKEITISINQTLTQDSTGTMVYLQLEALNPPSIKTDLSVAYIDHNMLQSGFENADDHAFIKSVANKRGIVFSKPGGGICHQVHLERFTKPGTTLIGSDSHTPTAGGVGAIAIGAGGLDVAVAMAKGYYHLILPEVYEVKLIGKLPFGVNAKDVILHVLEKLSVKGGVGYAMEYTGPGIASLSVTDRATICNMGAELGATTSIFPSDDITKEFLIAQGRPNDYVKMEADENAVYSKTIEVDLSEIKPLVAKPHMPDEVCSVEEVSGIKVDQVAIGSCTNSSYSDMMKVARILEGNHVAPNVDLVISPGSANILRLLAESGALAKMISAGARILESACGPCIGMGQSPKTDAVSLRTFNRNFKGRSGTMSAQVYLVSPETAAYSAIKGTISDPSNLDINLDITLPDNYGSTDNYFIYPDTKGDKSVVMGPNIKPFPLGSKPENDIKGKVLLKTEDNITTDDIVPSHSKLLPFRSNVPHLSKFAFSTIVDDFHERATQNNGGFIVGGENYGQGSSREHAALVPLHLGIRAVIAKSFARIHRNNLINSGIIPLLWSNTEDYSHVNEMDELILYDIPEALKDRDEIICYNTTRDEKYILKLSISSRERDILQAGGYLLYVQSSEVI